MKQETALASSSRRGGRLRATLVGMQVALCMVLMIAAGLLLRGLYATYTIDPGFEYRDVVYVSLESAHEGYGVGEAEVRNGVWQATCERCQAWRPSRSRIKSHWATTTARSGSVSRARTIAMLEPANRSVSPQ